MLQIAAMESFSKKIRTHITNETYTHDGFGREYTFGRPQMHLGRYHISKWEGGCLSSHPAPFLARFPLRQAGTLQMVK
jgi:hypothetical protein